MLTKNFSGALQLSDLDDFIGPSQQCIIPMQNKLAEDGEDGLVKLRNRKQKTNVDETPKVAKITLNDCLACSGCITSAESILIEQQDYREVQRCLTANRTFDRNDPQRKVTVMSISPQSLASLAAVYQLDGLTCARRLTAFVKSKFGIDHVFDISFARNYALIEVKNEFVQRFRNNRLNLPLLTSECPGWVCYAEKTQGEYIIPFMSRVKSPQQILGSLIKIDKNQPIYHVSVEPCFDKKLEASRKDFFNEERQEYDVDCVISTGEFHKWLSEEDFYRNFEGELDYDQPFVMKDSNGQMILTHRASGSGGYLDYIFRSAAKELFNVDVPSGPLEFKLIKNQDFRETTLTIDGEVRLRFAFAYGFRNIQNIVQQMKRQKCSYDFVEIMACPSGCLNGGGQIRGPTTRIDEVRNIYENLSHLNEPIDLRSQFDQSIPLYTEYRPIQKDLANSFNKIKQGKMSTIDDLPSYDDEEGIQLIENDDELQFDEEIEEKNEEIPSARSSARKPIVFDEIDDKEIEKQRTKKRNRFDPERYKKTGKALVFDKVKLYLRDGPNRHHVETRSITEIFFVLPKVEDLSSINLNKEQTEEIWKSLNLTEESFRVDPTSNGVHRPESLYLCGVKSLNTQKIFDLFEEFQPVGIEWISDNSCNIFWSETLSPIRVLNEISTVGPSISRESQSENSSKKRKFDETFQSKENSHLNPGSWRKIQFSDDDQKDASILFHVRYSTIEDRKLIGSQKHSEYYREHGNPNCNNMKGLISRSKRIEFMREKANKFCDFTVVKSNDQNSTSLMEFDDATTEEIQNEAKTKFTVVLPPKKIQSQDDHHSEKEEEERPSKRQRRAPSEQQNDEDTETDPQALRKTHFTVTIDPKSNITKDLVGKRNQSPIDRDEKNHRSCSPVLDAREILRRKRRERV